jgi:hypothetical protein
MRIAEIKMKSCKTNSHFQVILFKYLTIFFEFTTLNRLNIHD